MREKIILIGGGGHCKSCIDVIEQDGTYRIEGIVDIPEKLHQKIMGYEVIATDEHLSELANDYENFFITIGQIKSPDKRIQLFNALQQLGVKMPVIISPLAYVSNHAVIGDGTIIMHHALVNAGAGIGCNCIINSKALIEHDAVIGDHCHISTAAVINGGVKIGTGSFLGSNTVCKEYIEISEGAVIGCGTKNTRDF
ncbi:MAG: NeuD/PglB/VioB family sugar acetyltransferase [Pseudomonadota bacterium]